MVLASVTRRRKHGSSGLDDRSLIAFLWSPTRRGREAMAKRSASSVRGERAAGNERRTVARSKIDFSDIPELSDKQLRTMRRVGRPPIGSEARQLIAIRLDPEVLSRFRAEAKRLKIGYQTLIHRVLAEHVGARVA